MIVIKDRYMKLKKLITQQDKRLRRIERAVIPNIRSLRFMQESHRLVLKMYQQFYAVSVRRKKTYGVNLRKALAQIKKVKRDLGHIKRFAKLAGHFSKVTVSLKQGRRLLTVNDQERCLIQSILRRKNAFKARPSRAAASC